MNTIKKYLPYIPAIEEQLGIKDAELKPAPFGWVVYKDSWKPSPDATSVSICGYKLNLRNLVLSEMVLIIEHKIDTMIHDESKNDIFKNIGRPQIKLTAKDEYNSIILPRKSYRRQKICYGLDVTSYGILYVARTIHPQFADAYPASFYKSKQYNINN